MAPRPSRPRATSVASSVDATHGADRGPSARQVLSNCGVGATLTEGLAGGRIPANGVGGGAGCGGGGAGCGTGAGCDTGAGVGALARGAGAGGGGGGGAAATAATGGAGIVVGVGGGGGAVVEVVVVAACSASMILRIATRGDSLRVGRGAGGPLWLWRLPAAAIAVGPAVAARTVAPGSDTMSPRRASVRLAGRRAFCRRAARFG